MAPSDIPASSGTSARDTLVLSRGDVARLLPLAACIDAVERAFRMHAEGTTIPPAVLGVHVEHGGFHVKTAGVFGSPPLFAAKINANFPGNPDHHALPTIQGVVALFDAACGRPLALMDSMELTTRRTAAATAVAARYLARADAATLTLCGCGEQGRMHLRALALVRQLQRIVVFDEAPSRAETLAHAMSSELALDVDVTSDVRAAARESDIVVTCTPSRRWFLGREDVRPGAFVGAVGADNPEKQEIEPELLAANTVVADVLDQCAAIGDLHHALAAGVMRREDVHAELADVISGRVAGRRTADEIIVFDSTGTALEDVAAAALVYERASSDGTGLTVSLGSTGGAAERVAKGRSR